MTQQKLPLFPLNTVLFPGAPLTLHIFEERYRQMIGRCLEQSTPFGVVLIREGDEVVEGMQGGRVAEPHDIGTVAQISANVRLDDGRYILTVIGQRRFRRQYYIQRAPYIVASVAILHEESTSEVVPLAQELRETCERYWRALAAATGVKLQPDRLPDDIVAMTYQIADRLQVPYARKQHWLEADLPARIRDITAALSADLALLPPSGRTARLEEWSGMGSLN